MIFEEDIYEDSDNHDDGPVGSDDLEDEFDSAEYEPSDDPMAPEDEYNEYYDTPETPW